MMFAYVRRFVVLTGLGCLTLLTTGCSPAQQVVGTWNIDPSKPIPAEFFDANPLVASLMSVGSPEVRVTMNGDGAFSSIAGIGPIKQERTGSWRFVKTEGKTLLLMVKESGKDEETELRFTPLDAEHADLRMELDINGKKIKPAFSFVKAKPGS
ncbi:hypothetical protein ETAA8_58830 [Anatilimnocola aggregata]|uniref:Lipocalin-like domain-containing protein n=1 Tax=Anatilimnocola aggregata TaxID=2528021 RepID=A0A517YKJ7_9BACT|nr:hypothetical protein [Anatilimnocola aggregata]QDU30735.1 hypothetical protein ETAA8_58830 [Anatilimnocola aggregata]